MKSKDNTQILQTLLIENEHSGMESSSSSNNKETQPRKISMMLNENSSPQLSSYKSLSKNQNLRVKLIMP